MWTVILSLLVLFYFIQGQFAFERPTRLRYWVLPIFALVMFSQTFKVTAANVWIAVAMVGLGIIIGILQGRYATIRPLLGASGEARVEVKGGWLYLAGWAVMLIVQLGMEVIFAHHALTVKEVSNEAFQSVIDELFPIRRLQGSGWWVLWALTAGSGLAYTLTLMHRSEGFRATIKRHAHRNDRRAERRHHQ
ncbi:hypothetical protein [Furfurilactobacillus entadae]|uniref:hypothetical protein n=1 Tax=Furfurilactobacillus entadae TaxID=2922307 RepID=UPI0035E60282